MLFICKKCTEVRKEQSANVKAFPSFLSEFRTVCKMYPPHEKIPSKDKLLLSC